MEVYLRKKILFIYIHYKCYINLYTVYTRIYFLNIYKHVCIYIYTVYIYIIIHSAPTYIM